MYSFGKEVTFVNDVARFNESICIQLLNHMTYRRYLFIGRTFIAPILICMGLFISIPSLFICRKLRACEEGYKFYQLAAFLSMCLSLVLFISPFTESIGKYFILSFFFSYEWIAYKTKIYYPLINIIKVNFELTILLSILDKFILLRYPVFKLKWRSSHFFRFVSLYVFLLSTMFFTPTLMWLHSSKVYCLYRVFYIDNVLVNRSPAFKAYEVLREISFRFIPSILILFISFFVSFFYYSFLMKRNLIFTRTDTNTQNFIRRSVNDTTIFEVGNVDSENNCSINCVNQDKIKSFSQRYRNKKRFEYTTAKKNLLIILSIVTLGIVHSCSVISAGITSIFFAFSESICQLQNCSTYYAISYVVGDIYEPFYILGVLYLCLLFDKNLTKGLCLYFKKISPWLCLS